MAGIDIKRFLSNFGQNYHNQTFSAKSTFNAPAMPAPAPAQPAVAPKAPDIMPQTQIAPQSAQPAPMNSNTNAAFAREVLGFPRNANEFVFMVQRGLTQAQVNQMFSNQLMAQRNNLSQMQAQILAQLQGLDISSAKEMVNIQLGSQVHGSLKNLEILSNGMINLSDVAALLQKNGKDAVSKLIMSMTEASKAGIKDLTQMKDMAKLINASISVAAENNPQKTLKLLLMLYLPWLPLEDGVGFDLEIQNKNDSSEENESVLTITVSTLNYGVVRATIYLESSNSVQISVECGKSFPKDELKLRIQGEQKHYSVDSVMSFEINENIKVQTADKQSASINMSQTNEINPYLLLMAHSVIKHIIDIDNNKSAGIVSHTDKFNI